MQLQIEPISKQDAEAVSQWRYDDPYALYSLSPSDVDWLLQPQLNYHSVRREDGEIVGYFCFGPDAQVPAGHELGLYRDQEALDVGLGMRPDLTGQGLGMPFLQAGLEYAKKKYAPSRFRLTVATFNHRAIRLYEKAGFEPVSVFRSTVGAEHLEFLLMEHPAVSGD